MKVVNIVKAIKQIHPEYIVLIKIGKFYYSYSKDAYIVSYIFNYKLNKIMAKLEENKINYIVIDRRNNYEVDEKINNGNLNKYNFYLEKSKRYINQKNRIEEIYNYLVYNIEKNENNKLIKEIESLINERRKI